MQIPHYKTKCYYWKLFYQILKCLCHCKHMVEFGVLKMPLPIRVNLLETTDSCIRQGNNAKTSCDVCHIIMLSSTCLLF